MRLEDICAYFVRVKKIEHIKDHYCYNTVYLSVHLADMRKCPIDAYMHNSSGLPTSPCCLLLQEASCKLFS
jgi:hypothetical protein